LKVKYFKDKDLTAEKLGQVLGVKVRSITIGAIDTGELPESDTPTVKEGIEVEFGVQPTDEQLARLDIVLPDYKRDGGRSLADRIQEIEAKVKAIEAKG